MTNVSFVATINITVKKIVTLPSGQVAVQDAEMREATAEGQSPREAADKAFAQGFERFISGLPEASQIVLPIAVPGGGVREQ